MNSFGGRSPSTKLFQGVALEEPSKSTGSLVPHPNIDHFFPDSPQNFYLFIHFLVILIIILERNLH